MGEETRTAVCKPLSPLIGLLLSGYAGQQRSGRRSRKGGPNREGEATGLCPTVLIDCASDQAAKISQGYVEGNFLPRVGVDSSYNMRHTAEAPTETRGLTLLSNEAPAVYQSALDCFGFTGLMTVSTRIHPVPLQAGHFFRSYRDPVHPLPPHGRQDTFGSVVVIRGSFAGPGRVRRGRSRHAKGTPGS